MAWGLVKNLNFNCSVEKRDRYEFDIVKSVLMVMYTILFIYSNCRIDMLYINMNIVLASVYNMYSAGLWYMAKP